MTVLYIDTAQQLNQLCETLSRSDWYAVDTEFLREKTYYPQLCLIQIATDEVIACIDPIKLDNLDPLLEILYQDGKTVVFHAARQDLELLFQLRGALPASIFDTQLAATVLGYGDQIGYGSLVSQCLNVELDKAHSRTDWSLRPLSDAQLDYAADDVRYLCQLYQLMSEQLETKQRRSWLNEDFAELSKPELYQAELMSIWKKIKGAGRLKPSQLVVLQYLAAWREQEAIKRNKPRRWIIKDEVMLDMARFSPETIQQLAKIRGFEGRDADRHGKAILQAIQTAKAVDREHWPQIKKPKPLSSQQDAIVDCLMALLRRSCDQQSITPAAVAGRKDIESLVRGDEDTPLLHGWRFEIVGHELCDFLQGSTSIKVNENQLQITESH
jgi:ribonuclease D